MKYILMQGPDGSQKILRRRSGMVGDTLASMPYEVVFSITENSKDYVNEILTCLNAGYSKIYADDTDRQIECMFKPDNTQARVHSTTREGK